MRPEFMRAVVAAVAWILVWGILAGGLALGVEGVPAPSMALCAAWFGGASGLLFGLAVFFGWWRGLPLWLRGALYGLLAAVPVVVVAALTAGNERPLDWWKAAAALMLSGLFGYLFRECLAD